MRGFVVQRQRIFGMREAKSLAAKTGRTLTAVLQDALREFLSKRQVSTTRPIVTLTTVGGRGVLEGVDLDDSAALLDVMDATR